ncbi:MAG TPA: penicillin-binding protein 2, partial [Chloroflexota bacterium]
GINGVEQYFDPILAGRAGIRTVLRDTAGHSIRLSAQAPTPAHNGGDLTLTLDPTIQEYAEIDVRNAVKTHRADAGTIIVTDPNTGRILAMTSAPTYNPNYFNVYANRGQASLFQNPAIQFAYEPGSTFKIVTMASGLDSKVITPQSTLYDSGSFRIANVVLHNWNDQGNGIENMTQVLQHSANVGASWVAGHLGVNRFYHYVNSFGIGRPTGVGLAGEYSGTLPEPKSKEWTIVNLYTNSFGQGLTVTPLQLVSAVGAVANGGLLMKPQIVRQTAYDGRVIANQPTVVRRVISAATAHTLTNMLVHSAVNGEAQLALVHGYNIAAKTGTANIAGPNGKYLQNVTNASVVGYAPAFHPRFCVLVLLQHPRDFIWGSMTAAPVMSTIFKQLFMYFHIPPSAHPLYP